MTMYRKGQTEQDNPFSLASSECSSPSILFLQMKNKLVLANFKSPFELASWPRYKALFIFRILKTKKENSVVDRNTVKAAIHSYDPQFNGFINYGEFS